MLVASEYFYLYQIKQAHMQPYGYLHHFEKKKKKEILNMYFNL